MVLESFAESNENLARKFLRREDGILFNDLAIKQTDEVWNERYGQKGSHLKILVNDIIAKLKLQ